MNEGKSYLVKRTLNNNTVLAVDEFQKEVVLLGKGIGFNRKKGEWIPYDSSIEKIFVLSSDNNRETMLRIFTETEEEIIHAINDYIQYIEDRLEVKLTEQFLVSFIDHISFAIKRLKQGIQIQNPFLHEVRSLYPEEYALAQDGVNMLSKLLKMEIPDDEIGFITLHLHSAKTKQSVSKMNQFSSLIGKLIQVIENELEIKIDRDSIDYARLITHLRFAIERTERNQFLDQDHPLTTLLRKEYPICYNLSWQLVKIMQNELKAQIPEAEVSYLTLHIERIYQKMNTK
ncbi:PRD domain-containing protein [Tepidibacillus infernus]|uniref:glucose PTS transporter transcription antiterminator GlcT n=1 Tax=Tepidibacillus infernus TaxID=1806172 RepID=UPI003B7151B5